MLNEICIVTCGLKAATCASAGRSFAGRVPVATRNTPLLWVLMELLETYQWQRHSKQTVTTDMTNRTLQGGDSYPRRLAGIKGEQFRSRQFGGGRVEYLHGDPASRRRRRKGKSQI
jgi:hypothetical protein